MAWKMLIDKAGSKKNGDRMALVRKRFRVDRAFPLLCKGKREKNSHIVFRARLSFY